MDLECWATIAEVYFEDDTIQLLRTTNTKYPAILYKRFFPTVTKGTLIKLNHTATELGLGTGGYDLVKEVLASKRIQENIDGHIMKLRYTPMQQAMMSIEEPGSPHHSLFQKSFTLEGKKVLLAELHSMVPLIYYLAQEIEPTITCCVIFDDSASLLLEGSQHVRLLQKEVWFHSITIGQCVGGEYEAISLPSALQFASTFLKADLIIISVGPGVVGTGTEYGHSAMEMANWANVVGALGGCPVWIPRLSFADKRNRHYGLSHHTITPLYSFTYCSCVLVFPLLVHEQKSLIAKQLNSNSLATHLITYQEEPVDRDLLERAFSRIEGLTTMGRGYTDDPLFFEAVAEAVCFCIEGKTS